MRWIFLLMVLPSAAFADPPSVKLVRTPEGGLQPQAAVDRAGTVHLIYFKGDPKAGDVFYVRQKAGETNFSAPIRVNSRDGSVMAIGTIRGAQMALGKNGRLHVAWNGAAGAEPAVVGEKRTTPMVYTRLDGEKFEPERNVLTFAAGLDGGGSVAVDEAGNVYIAWHASQPGNNRGEAGRAVFVAHSSDEGKTFSTEQRATDIPTGACGCCGMKAFARGDELYMLYRGASTVTNRDMHLIASGKTLLLDRWVIPGCPMSSATIIGSGEDVFGAWETASQIWLANLNSPAAKTSPSGEGKRKHPSLAVNADGAVLLAWTENTGWAKGGSVAWQLFTKDLRPIGKRGSAPGVPPWSLASTVALPSKSFVVFY
jgi:hypothetical protein